MKIASRVKEERTHGSIFVNLRNVKNKFLRISTNLLEDCFRASSSRIIFDIATSFFSAKRFNSVGKGKIGSFETVGNGGKFQNIFLLKKIVRYLFEVATLQEYLKFQRAKHSRRQLLDPLGCQNVSYHPILRNWGKRNGL